MFCGLWAILGSFSPLALPSFFMSTKWHLWGKTGKYVCIALVPGLPGIVNSCARPHSALRNSLTFQVFYSHLLLSWPCFPLTFDQRWKCSWTGPALSLEEAFTVWNSVHPAALGYQLSCGFKASSTVSGFLPWLGEQQCVLESICIISKREMYESVQKRDTIRHWWGHREDEFSYNGYSSTNCCNDFVEYIWIYLYIPGDSPVPLLGKYKCIL